MPQMPVLWIRINTSSACMFGTGAVCSHRPSQAWALINALISDIILTLQPLCPRAQTRLMHARDHFLSGQRSFVCEFGLGLEANGIEEATDIDSFFKQRGGHILRQMRLCQHYGNDRVFAWVKCFYRVSGLAAIYGCDFLCRNR